MMARLSLPTPTHPRGRPCIAPLRRCRNRLRNLPPQKCGGGSKFNTAPALLREARAQLLLSCLPCDFQGLEIGRGALAGEVAILHEVYETWMKSRRPMHVPR